MKKQKVQSCINLETLAGGAFTEKLNEAIKQVAENIQNQNTDATAKRGITVNIKFAPNKTRQLVNTSISVTTKLAATEAIDTQMVMGVDMKTGQIEFAEYDGQIRGQLTFQDTEQATDSEPAGAQENEAEQAQAQPSPTGKPLDLRNRSKAQETEPPVPVPGRDFDPETGEVYETAKQATDDQKTTGGRVVPFGAKSAQA